MCSYEPNIYYFHPIDILNYPFFVILFLFPFYICWSYSYPLRVELCKAAAAITLNKVIWVNSKKIVISFFKYLDRKIWVNINNVIILVVFSWLTLRIQHFSLNSVSPLLFSILISSCHAIQFFVSHLCQIQVPSQESHASPIQPLDIQYQI